MSGVDRSLLNRRLLPNISLLLLVLLSLLSCSSIGDSGKNLDCGIEFAQIEFPELLFSGPLDKQEVMSLYEREIKPYETPKLAEDWISFLKEAERQGCIFTFTTNKKSWQSLSGSKGYAIVNDGEVINLFITTRS
ncbi:MAG: hypothetical protein MI864_11850 [Pseudomonadales bacterium]|nr:hypothetical protein [Pseudomonadales bacterium]